MSTDVRKINSLKFHLECIVLRDIKQLYVLATIFSGLYISINTHVCNDSEWFENLTCLPWWPNHGTTKLGDRGLSGVSILGKFHFSIFWKLCGVFFGFFWPLKPYSVVRCVLEWSVPDVCDWLDSLFMPEYKVSSSLCYPHVYPCATNLCMKSSCIKVSWRRTNWISICFNRFSTLNCGWLANFYIPYKFCFWHFGFVFLF